ncbi:hypothetical protein AAC03nite_04520 [Alicyclobacillus acidoterrestris]|nr:hypothetical protein AAC03nite_04520 [Alicyclobacillus acidoterrestris]
MYTVYDAATSVPSATFGSLSRSIPGTPSNIVLAEFGLATSSPSPRVLLAATVGVSAVLLAPNILFSILRDGAVIFTTQSQESLTVIQNETISFTTADANVAPGYHSYQLVASLTNALLNAANVVGPVTFTGISLA